MYPKKQNNKSDYSITDLTKLNAMKKRALLLSLVFVCLCTFSTAQISLADYATYNLEVIPFRTDFGNTLTEKDINLTFSNLRRVEKNGDVHIRVVFLTGLRSNYLLQTAITDIGFAYRVAYKTPAYRVTAIDNKGNLLLQKIYGGEDKQALYGEFLSLSSPEDLEFEWEKGREAYYKELESSQETLTRTMDEDLKIAVLNKAQEIATGEPITASPQSEPTGDTEETRTITPGKNGPRKNIYKPSARNKPPSEPQPGDPILNASNDEQYSLNGLIEVAACSKYSYQLTNKHPFATLSVFLQKSPGEEVQELILPSGQVKLFKGLPHKDSWIVVAYLQDDFQGDQIDLKEQVNQLAGEEASAHAITNLIEQFYTQFKPTINFAPKVSSKTGEVVDYVQENDSWQDQLKVFLSESDLKISKANQTKVIKKNEQILNSKALRNISTYVEKDLYNPANQKLIYPIIKSSKNFRNITPLLSLEYAQSITKTGGLNEYWKDQSANRISLSARLPFEWQLSTRKSGSFSTIHVKASYELLSFDWNRVHPVLALDPENPLNEPEAVLPEEQFSFQTTQLSAGLAWKLYFPLPIVELEGGAFFSHKTRLLWGEDSGQFPRKIFSPENEIISKLADLNAFRPYIGAKLAIPYYFSGYKFDCDSRLRNVQLFGSFRMYPVNFTSNDKYQIFIRDNNSSDLLKAPLLEGNSKWLMQIMVGAAVEF